jgi:hypothetical protein
MDVRTALKGQYHAALNMLKDSIDRCPDDLWNAGPPPVPFWHVAYHTLYYTDLYLGPGEAGFVPWERHRQSYQYLDREPRAEQPYTKAEILEYWRLLDARVDADVDRLDLDAAESGFSWHKTIPKFEHQIHNIRHIQHHAAMLSGRLILAGRAGARWMRSVAQTYRD